MKILVVGGAGYIGSHLTYALCDYGYDVKVLDDLSSGFIENIDKRKFLVPTDLTFGQLIGVVRKRINISKEKAIFLFCQNTIPASSTVVGMVYESFKDEDGFLYLEYSGENTFGNKI